MRGIGQSTNVYNSQEGEELEGFQQGPKGNSTTAEGSNERGNTEVNHQEVLPVRSPVLLVTVCQRETRVKQDQMKWEPEYSSGKSLKWFTGGWANF